MDKARIDELMRKDSEDAEYAEGISDKVVSEYTKDLDGIMRNINSDIIVRGDAPDSLISSYFMELTNAMYFIGAKAESLGLFDDISRSNARLKYSQAYGNALLDSASKGKAKPTVAENQLSAEMGSLDETVVNYIYARAYRIVKTKCDSASEMIRTLSKILTKRQADENLSSMSGRISQ